MPEKLDFRPLLPSEIECRVGNVARNGSGFFLLLYKNARVDQIILDETVGQFDWKCNYYQVKNTMVCSVAIWCKERNEWVSKDNGGDDDYQAEQVKAELSDAFKRACFNWGIGRELYYSPKIWVACDGENDVKDHYSVKVIEYNENKRITNLVIINDKTKKVVFTHGKSGKVAQTSDLTTKNPTPTPTNDPLQERGSIDKQDLTIIQAYVTALNNETRRRNFYTWLDEKFGTMSIESLTYTQGKEVLETFGGKK